MNISERRILFNARVITPFRAIPRGGVIVEGGEIDSIFEGDPPIAADGARIDLGGMYLAPGFVELHTHGAGGHDFMDGSREAVIGACRAHMRHGVTSILPSTLTSTDEELFRNLDLIGAAMKAGPASRDSEEMPRILGVHLEGPYFSPEQKGAQDPRYLKNPSREEYCRWLDKFPFIKRWTVAPELPGALEMGRELRARGVLASIGHSNAVYEEVLAAFENGYTLVTHLFNGMSRLTRPKVAMRLGVAESALAIDGLTVEIIADGCHLPPELLKLIYKIKGSEAIMLTSDSIRAAGLDVSESILGSKSNGQRVVIEGGVAYMPDRSSFGGSIATADRLVRTMVRMADVPLTEAVRMLTHVPAKLLGMEKRIGSISPGLAADLVAFDESIEARLVMIAGKIVSRT